jgi:preprotein translocase subunit YajC
MKFLFFLFLAVPQIILAAPQAAGSGGEAPSGPLGSLSAFLPLIAIFAIFYFLIIRPQSKKQKETQKMLSALKKGDKIVTIGGIHGVIQKIKEGTSTVIVRVDENTALEFSRSAVSSVESQAKEDKEDKKADKIEDKTGDKKSGEKRLEAPAEDKDEENDGEK